MTTRKRTVADEAEMFLARMAFREATEAMVFRPLGSVVRWLNNILTRS
jgi:hypothetical protein